MPMPRRAADAAKHLLRSASRHLMTPDPTHDRVLDQALDRSLDWSIDDGRIAVRSNRSFEPSFSENTAGSLAFQVKPLGPGLSAEDQRQIANSAVRGLIHEHFGRDPLLWFDQRSEQARAQFGSAQGVGARYALSVERDGLGEIAASYEWGPRVLEMLPGGVMSLARTALDLVPGLRPFCTVIRCSRGSGGQQVSFELTRDTRLDDFRPLMDALGMGQRHGGLTTLLAFVLGARFVLPADSSTLTLLNTRQGPELRLDVNIDALPDAPEQLLPLLRLPMTERPQKLAALDRWMTAMTPEGYFGPGQVTVLSVRVRADMPARLALYLRPVAMAGQPARSDRPLQVA